MSAKLARLLGLRFQQPELLRAALTHRSAGAPNSERLEFLGDAVLNCVIADTLFQRFPDASEGELTRLRSNLVRGETLAGVGRRLQLRDHLIMGSGELKSGGYRRDSVLEDAIEAIIGATFQDQGIESARKLITRLLRDEIAALNPNKLGKDPKTRLQEYQQKHNMPLPNYHLDEVSGPDHRRQYRVSCHIDGLAGQFTGNAGSRRHAEQAAASAALAALQQQKPVP
jgi:ribonuclease-3